MFVLVVSLESLLMRVIILLINTLHMVTFYVYCDEDSVFFFFHQMLLSANHAHLQN
jgi:hypothetical protein